MVAAFFINTGYFLIGCATSSKTGDQYRIEWTTSHCVLILKLTGVVADLYDGSKPLDKLGADQKETAIQKKPTLLQLIGHCYFFGGFLIGPQCSIKRYLTLVEGGFSSKGNGVPDSLLAGLTKLGVGLVYIGNLLLLNFLVPTDYLFTKEFHDLLLPLKCLYVLVWGRFVLTRYISCWHISEGICILTGLTYNGIDKNGKSQWDSSQNIKLYEFETSYTLYNLTKAFNVQTSTWMVKYLMKRLRFLGNKELSKFFTFAYLALWHGLYSGYFNTFFLEFLMIATETYVIDRLKHKKVPPFPKGKLNGVWLWFLFRVIYCQFFWSYALISFELLQFQNYWEVYSSMYFIGHLCHPLVILITYLIFKRPPRKSENGIQKEKEL
ncbi:LPCAT3 [Acanthosepion pharaonis]|uniref:Lysophospholipid acyltransferase 5 n=1 Tax=Acanthosepion pharaonis TaxID=158019 RepID=A0A812D3T9_ACAPH|nr:LPCAT3 [Sepia pharaonis]